jgi:hypothetical protein
MVHTFAFLGQELRKDALVAEQLDQLPLYPANHRGRDARSGLARLAMFAPRFDVAGLELVNLPRADRGNMRRSQPIKPGYGASIANALIQPRAIRQNRNASSVPSRGIAGRSLRWLGPRFC